jgi:exosortase
MSHSPETSVRTAPRALRERAASWWRGLTPFQKRRIAGCAAYAILVTLLLLKPLASLMMYTSGTELHSHVVLVPLISAYLLCLKRRELPADYQTSPGWGFALAVAGLAALVTSWYLPPLSVNDRHVLPALAWVGLLSAGGFLFLGRKWMSVAAFPACFLLFVVPLPDGVVTLLERASQLASSEVTGWYFELARIPYLRNGAINFTIPGFSFSVEDECSGIRSSWVLLITSLVASHLFLKGPWWRAAVVFLVIPLGILRNGFRIFLIARLRLEDHWIHERGGPLFFALALVPLFMILFWFRKLEMRSAPRRKPAMLPESQC